MAMLTRLTSSGAATVATAAPGSPKALQRFQNCIAFIFPSLQTAAHRQQQVQRKSTQLDAIDCFTNELVNNKTRKWEDLRDSLTKRKSSATETTKTTAVAAAAAKSTSTTSFTQSVGLMSKGVVQDFEDIRSPQLGLDIRTLSRPQLDNLLLSTLEIKNKLDFLYLIRQCIQWQRLPSNSVLIQCLKYLSSLCHFQQIESFAEICRSQGDPLAKTYADFSPFKAMALWRSGGADVALRTLRRGYDETTATDEGRRMIRIAFRTISEETLTQKSEAVLVSLMEVARSIYEEHKDIFVVACVWKQCFASKWFCDQKVAEDLFEHYKELRELVGRRSTSLCSSFLSRNNVDAVHRLIEAFLQYNQRDACANCLSLLFNYQYNRNDLRACAEIIKSCSELEMPLSEMQNEQFLSLFLNQTEISPTTANAQKASKTFKEFQYKF